MKIKKNAMMTALAFSVAFNLNGCTYGPPIEPSDNIPQAVYGPPVGEYRAIENNTASQNDNNDSEVRSASEDTNGTDGTNEGGT